MSELLRRRSQTDRRIEELRQELGDAAKLAIDKACVYATGSFGRREASTFSDLDLFILAKDKKKPGSDEPEGSLLSKLDEICIKADLIEVTRRFNIPDFSGEGRYLVHYSVKDLIGSLGTPDDDATNTFTARLLLLLESLPLIGETVYQEATRDVIAAYWRDYEDHRNNFIPAFLANDILRLWRTFCVNYEARTQRTPDREKSKGKLKNYKLKHSRLLTCYSALLYLLATYSLNNTVAPADAVNMITLTPTDRLTWICSQERLKDAHEAVANILNQYEKFLVTTNAPEDELIEKFQNSKLSRQYMEDSYTLGDFISKSIAIIGNSTRLHRLITV